MLCVFESQVDGAPYRCELNRAEDTFGTQRHPVTQAINMWSGIHINPVKSILSEFNNLHKLHLNKEQNNNGNYCIYSRQEKSPKLAYLLLPTK